jgi:hypothetical protein
MRRRIRWTSTASLAGSRKHDVDNSGGLDMFYDAMTVDGLVRCSIGSRSAEEVEDDLRFDGRTI